MLRPAVLVTLIAALGGCPGPSATGPRPPAVATGERLTVPGGSVPIYAYPETIDAYADDDRGAYVVHVEPGPSGDELRAYLAPRTDDVIGDDGHVLRLRASELVTVRRYGFKGAAPLQPGQRRSTRPPRPVANAAGLAEVRIDLFADATSSELETVAAWIEWRGGLATWRGPTALVALLRVDDIAAASRLSPVRWVE